MRRVSTVILSMVALSALALPGSAQAQFASGQRYIGAHIGLSGVGSAAAFGLDGEIAYNDRIGIGAWLDTWSYGQSIGVTSWDLRYVAIAATGAYHFPVPSNPKIDPFLGAALGYFIVSSSVQGVGGGIFTGSSNRAFLGGFGGVRYVLSEKVSGVARLGVGASYLTVGIDVKM